MGIWLPECAYYENLDEILFNAGIRYAILDGHGILNATPRPRYGVYAPIYYGFGEPGSFADRRQRAREWERELFALAPDTILVLVSATASTIRTRMSLDPHSHGLLTNDHVDEVTYRFHEEYTSSLLTKKINTRKAL